MDVEAQNKGCDLGTFQYETDHIVHYLEKLSQFSDKMLCRVRQSLTNRVINACSIVNANTHVCIPDGNVHTSAACSAGHAKWQNIQNTKNSKDHAKSLAFQKLSMEIKMACISKYPK